MLINKNKLLFSFDYKSVVFGRYLYLSSERPSKKLLLLSSGWNKLTLETNLTCKKRINEKWPSLQLCTEMCVVSAVPFVLLSILFFCSQNADYTNHQIADLSEKLEQAESQVRSKVICWLFRLLSLKLVLPDCDRWNWPNAPVA